MSSPQYVKGICSSDYWTDSDSNRLTQEHLHQPVTLTDPAIALTSPPGTGEESAQGGQGMSTFCHTPWNCC